MNVSLEHLRTLRRQAGQQPPLAAHPASNEVGRARPAAAAVTIETLRRFLGSRARQPAQSQPRTQAPFRVIDRALPGEEIAPGLHYIERCSAWPTLTAPIFVDAKTYGPIHPMRVLCFDTETTGLTGGTGTRAFMIGVSECTEQGLRVRQLLCATLGAEPAMLRTFAGWIRPDHVLVSYNGQCYDAPLLATRFRLARLTNPLSGLPHADLLFAVRRRYRGVWPNCKLSTIERELLRVKREDDLPGSEAPSAWLGYLRGGDAINLRRVQAHNRQDVVSLMQLLGKFAE